MNLISLQLITTDNFENNLSSLIKKIKKLKKNSFIVAPELYLNGYAYDRLDEAVKISQKAIPLLKELSNNKTITLTLTMPSDRKDKYLNTLYCFKNGKIIHTQSKAELFVLNNEQKYFTSGKKEDIKLIDIDDIKIGFLICFELRFIDLWKQLQGADIIVIPAMWGKLRKENFITLTQALAVMNQCYVLGADASNEDCTSMSGIITPFGKAARNGNNLCLKEPYDAKEIKRMRRYLAVGIGEVS